MPELMLMISALALAAAPLIPFFCFFKKFYLFGFSVVFCSVLPGNFPLYFWSPERTNSGGEHRQT